MAWSQPPWKEHLWHQTGLGEKTQPLPLDPLRLSLGLPRLLGTAEYQGWLSSRSFPPLVPSP